MKLIASIALVVSFSASAACPDLSGTYRTCTTSSGEVSEGSVFTQSTVGGITTYQVDSIAEDGTRVQETIVADGIARTVTQVDEETGIELVLNNTARCVGSVLNVNAKLSVQGQDLASIIMNVRKNGTKLTTVTTGNANGQPINETTICE